MLLFLSNLHKEHLQLLHEQHKQVLVSCCKLAIDYMQNGINVEKYKIAAEKLKLDQSSLQNIVQAIIYLLTEGCKYNLSEADFKSSLSMVELSAEVQEILTKLYHTRKNELSEQLYQLQHKEPTLQDLTWRFEVQVASRSQSDKVQPLIAMDLVLQKPKSSEQINLPKFINSNQSGMRLENDLLLLHIDRNIEVAKTASECQNIVYHVLLQSDLPNLVNMTNKLDQALKESKSQHVRKVQRALQR